MKKIIRMAVALIASASLFACAEPLAAPVEVGPYTVDAIEKGDFITFFG